MASTIGPKGTAWKAASVVTEALRNFVALPSSADRDLALDLETLRLRSRQLFQNNTFSRAMIESFTTNVVGTGCKCRPTLRLMDVVGLNAEQAEEWCRKTQRLFELWAESKNCDAERKNNFAQLQHLAFKSAKIGGDSFGLACYDKKNSAFGLCIKILEADRCQNPLGSFDSDALVHGVEVDKSGMPTAFHFSSKPTWSIDSYSDTVDCVRVPAYDALGYPNVIHVMSVDRTDQRRGVPLLAPLIMQLKQLERYQDAELMAAVVSACVTAVVTSNNDEEADDMGADEGNSETDSYGNPVNGTAPSLELSMKPGGIWSLPNKYSASLLNTTRPNVNYQPFVESIFSEAGAAAGSSYEVILKNFHTSNYNAVRAAVLESRKTFNRMRNDFISDFCQPIYEKWLAQAILTGLIDAPGFFDDPMKRAAWCGCRWISDAAFLLDPLKETQAIKMQIDEQLMDRDTACAMVNGGEYDVITDQLAKELNMRKAKGLGEPGSVTKTESFSVSTDDTNESSLN